ncbi:MAG: hypothetical protein HXY46_03525 [Syntrophaceae bacterium]|nr:hypothetical protein [Syntrophaceae bacterium]
MIQRKTGFSLVEVLIGLIFLAIGLLALAGLQITSIRGNSFSHHLMQATYQVQDRVERLKNLPLTSPELQPGSHNLEPFTLSGLVFKQSYTVIEEADLKTIHYTVEWDDGVGHRITFSTIRSQ